VTDNYDWWDRVLVFQVLPGNSPTSIGVSHLPLSIHWQETRVNKVDKAEKAMLVDVVAKQIQGITISCVESIAQMTVNQHYTLKVALQNGTDQLLSSSNSEPFNLSYHWFDENNNDVVFDGLRSSLKSPCLPYADAQGYDVVVKAPENIGQYRLDIALVEEGVRWYESADTASLQIQIVAI
jgi:hypothetical protein